MALYWLLISLQIYVPLVDVVNSYGGFFLKNLCPF